MPDERQGNPEKQPLPGSVSDQNAEEHPGQGGQPETGQPGSPDGGDDSAGGESSEGTQSTGNPDSAG